MVWPEGFVLKLTRPAGSGDPVRSQNGHSFLICSNRTSLVADVLPFAGRLLKAQVCADHRFGRMRERIGGCVETCEIGRLVEIARYCKRRPRCGTKPQSSPAP